MQNDDGAHNSYNFHNQYIHVDACMVVTKMAITCLTTPLINQVQATEQMARQ